MPFDWTKVSIAELQSLKLDELLATAPAKDCSDFGSVLDKASKEPSYSPTQKESLVFLSSICQMHLKASNASEPYGPMFVIGGKRSLIPADFPREKLVELEPWALEVTSAELRARLLDIIWVQTRSFASAAAAVDAYIESALELEDPDMWPSTVERLQRGLRLAASLGKSNIAIRDKVLTVIEDMLSRYRGLDPSYLSSRLIRLLLEFHYGNSTQFGDWIAAGAQKAMEAGDFWRAENHFRCAADCYRRAEDIPAQTKMLREAAEALVRESETALTDARGPMAAASILANAVDAMRQVPDGRARAEELHQRLLERQETALEHMGVISAELDCTELIEKAIAVVSGKSREDAIRALIVSIASPSIEKLKERTYASAREAPLSAILTAEVVNGRGKVVAKPTSIEDSNGDITHSGLRYRMFQTAKLDRHLYTQAIINPMRVEIALAHSVNRDDVWALIHYCPWIQGREETAVRAIVAGFDGDMMLVAYTIPFLFESLIRRAVELVGGITSSMDASGVQKEKTLNQLLEMPEASNVFGADAVFELQDLLCDEYGTNLRNEMAHCLLDDDQLFKADVLYAWWLYLRYCYFASEVAQRRQPPTRSS